MSSPTPSSPSPINSSWGIFISKATEGFIGGLQDEDLLHEAQVTELKTANKKLSTFISRAETFASDVKTLRNSSLSLSSFMPVLTLAVQGKRLIASGQTLATKVKRAEKGLELKLPLDRMRKADCNLLKSLFWIILGKVLTIFSLTRELGYSLIGSNLGKITALIVACNDNPTRREEVLTSLRNSYLIRYLAPKLAGSIRALAPPLKASFEKVDTAVETAAVFLPIIQATILSVLQNAKTHYLIGSLVTQVMERTEELDSKKIPDIAESIMDLLKVTQTSLHELVNLSRIAADCIEGKVKLEALFGGINKLVPTYTKEDQSKSLEMLAERLINESLS